MNVKRRLRALEKIRRVTPERLRLVVSRALGTADLANSSCLRYFAANGRIMEIVELDGQADNLSPEKLDRWIESHPIESRSSAFGHVRREGAP